MEDAFTIGVEEEYQLVAAETGELKSRAPDVLDADWSRELHPEVQQTMVEVGTPVCADAAELSRELRRVRFQAASTAAAEELAIVAAGLHPFSTWTGQKPSPEQRYQQLIEHYGRVMRSEHVFGMHVHVAVPAGADRIALINALRSVLPQLLALSASSPFYEGADTGYSSYRTILTGRLPHSGIPPRLNGEAEYRRFLELAVAAGTLEDKGCLYWNLRPHPRYPTLEFRGTDVCLSVEDAVAIAALARALTRAAVLGELREPDAGLSASAWDALLAANQWQAARFGLDATLIAPTAGSGREPLRDGVRRLLEQAAPHAEALGDTAALQGLEQLLERGSAAARMRHVARESGSLVGLVRWLARETVLGTGLDRRGEQRERWA